MGNQEQRPQRLRIPGEQAAMTMNPRPSFFDRLFGPGSSNAWSQWAAWQTQKTAWRAQRHAQRAAWKAQRDAQRAAWKAQAHARHWHYHGPFAALWGLAWTVFWVGLVLLLVFSPEFRARVMHFVVAIPQYVVRVLYALAGRSEI
jgi:hypothetical protein